MTEAEARRIVYERSGGLCEADGQARATEWAHRVRRGVGPWCPSNGLHLCHEHHAWCHRNPKAGEALGWILPATADWSAVPAVHWLWGHVLLLPDGSFQQVSADYGTRTA